MITYWEGMASLIAFRMAELIEGHGKGNAPLDFLMSEATEPQGEAFLRLCEEHQLNREERLLILLATAPGLQPALLDPFKMHNANWNQRFTEVGGYVEDAGNLLLPTLDTLLFLLSGSDRQKQFNYRKQFSATHRLFKSSLVSLSAKTPLLPVSASVLQPTEELYHAMLSSEVYSPEYSAAFPAKKIHTQLNWDELILATSTLHQVNEIKVWIEHHHTLYEDWGMGRILKPGYRSIFYGPPGTGKTLTAALLGKYTARDVYRVDLSLVVSKYIGETEKNLSKIFDIAEQKNWILFFDEADALFGKRTSISNAHDRYANQEVSFLLQRVEDYPGIVILATNLRANIDEAFSRRFQSIIRFPLPDAQQRILLWSNSLPVASRQEEHFDIEKLANRYELSGGSIINVIQYCCLMALERSSDMLLLQDAESGIKRELEKEGKSI